MPIDSILQRFISEDVFEIERPFPGTLAVDGDRPRLRLEAASVQGWVVHVRTEFVEVVVRRDVVPRVRCFAGAQRTRAARELASMWRRLLCVDLILGNQRSRGRKGDSSGGLDEPPSTEVDALARDF